MEQHGKRTKLGLSLRTIALGAHKQMRERHNRQLGKGRGQALELEWGVPTPFSPPTSAPWPAPVVASHARGPNDPHKA